MSELIRITEVSGRPIPLRGNDIDTDRIIPARFMKAVTFDGLGQYAFYDERVDAEGNAKGHILDDPRFQAKGDRIAIVNKNFGCGSSREHAPQALLRWGIKAIVGESFADIFFGNCVALGIPCVSVSEEDAETLLAAVEAHPDRTVTIDIENMRVTCGDLVLAAELPAGARRQLLEGSWDATRILLQAKDQVLDRAKALPYMRDFAG